MTIAFQILLLLILGMSALLSFAYEEGSEAIPRAMGMFLATLTALLVVTFL